MENSDRGPMWQPSTRAVRNRTGAYSDSVLEVSRKNRPRRLTNSRWHNFNAVKRTERRESHSDVSSGETGFFPASDGMDVLSEASVSNTTLLDHRPLTLLPMIRKISVLDPGRFIGWEPQVALAEDSKL